MQEGALAIRFGVVYNQTGLLAWQDKAIQAITALGNISLALLIELTAANLPAATSANRFLWNKYLKWGYKPAAWRPVALAEWHQQVPRLAYPAQATAPASQPATNEIAANIREFHLDFILSFAATPLSELWLQLPRLDVWAFEWGKANADQTQPVGSWELYTGAPLTTVVLCRRAGAGPMVVLREGIFRTKRAGLSRAADDIYNECAHWPADSCRQLLARQGTVSSQPYAPAAPPAAWPPTNGAMLAFLVRLAAYQLQQLYQTFLVADQWNIGVVNRPIRDFLQPASLQGVAIETPPLPNRNVFYADCFARQEATGPMIYFELYDYRRRRGNISRLPYPWAPAPVPATVLSFPYHLSYPFLHGPYCIPEAWVTQSIRLYDLREPLLTPATGHLLLPVPGVDATLLEYAGRYWLFYTRTDRDAMLNLFIAYADAVHGPWHEHPQNPVKTDIRSARPAGPFFEVAGKLYRPAQDCARDYGYALAIQEVLTLTATEYQEREVVNLPSLHPGYPAGMHTLAALDDTHTLIDFKRRRFIPMATLIAGWGVVSGIIYGKSGRRKPPTVAPAAA